MKVCENLPLKVQVGIQHNKSASFKSGLATNSLFRDNSTLLGFRLPAKVLGSKVIVSSPNQASDLYMNA